MINFDLGNFKKLENIFGFLKKERKHSVGLDISKNYIKIVEIEKQKKRLILKNYAVAKVSCELTDFSNINKKIVNNALGEIVSNIFKKNKIEIDGLNIAVPSFVALVTVFDLPDASPNQIEELIKAEAEKYIPLPLEEVIYDWQIINEEKISDINKTKDEIRELKKEEKSNEINRKNTFFKRKKIVLVAIIKDASYQFEKAMSSSGLQVNSLEISSFSLIRSLIGNDSKNYLILDIGDKICDINLVMNKNLIFHKNIDFAGNALTQSLARALNISPERAERIKIEEGLNIKNEDIKRLIYEPFLRRLVEEIQKTVKLLNQNYSGAKIEAVILSGGTSQLLGLREYLKEKTSFEVHLGNPWSKIECPEKAEKHLLRLGPSLAVAVGLAMLDFIDN